MWNVLCFYLSVSAFHELSVYPKKELPFFILFTAGLCSFTAMLAMLTHQFPDLMGVFVKAVSSYSNTGDTEYTCLCIMTDHSFIRFWSTV